MRWNDLTNCSEKTILHDNVTVGENGTLRFAGADTAALAAKYDLKAALNKKPGDFAALIRETKELLNH